MREEGADGESHQEGDEGEREFGEISLGALETLFSERVHRALERVRPSAARLGPASPSSSPSPRATASLIAVTIARRARRCAGTPGERAGARTESNSNARALGRPARADESIRRTCAREEEDADEEDARCEHDATEDAFVELIARIVETSARLCLREGCVFLGSTRYTRASIRDKETTTRITRRLSPRAK